MALIYLVEDDESIREIETIALKNSGHEVIGFENATGKPHIITAFFSLFLSKGWFF